MHRITWECLLIPRLKLIKNLVSADRMLVIVNVEGHVMELTGVSQLPGNKHVNHGRMGNGWTEVEIEYPSLNNPGWHQAFKIEHLKFAVMFSLNCCQLSLYRSSAMAGGGNF